MEQQKRYTIHMSVVEVDKDGDTSDQEVAGVTLDVTITDLEVMTGIMSEAYSFASDVFDAGWRGHANAASRRPGDEYDVE